MAKINCVLNKKFIDAQAMPHFKIKTCKTEHTSSWSSGSWYSQEKWLVDKKTKQKVLNLGAYCADQLTQCCGIDELDFRMFGEHEYNEDDGDFTGDTKEQSVLAHPHFDEVLAKIIDMQCSHKDQRVLIVGLPTSVGINSSYNIKAYKKILKVLKSFGFKELCPEPYKNKNSGNFITVLAGQRPE